MSMLKKVIVKAQAINLENEHIADHSREQIIRLGSMLRDIDTPPRIVDYSTTPGHEPTRTQDSQLSQVEL